MFRALVIVLLIGVIVIALGMVGSVTATDSAGVEIRAVYPNPIAAEDRGEYVVLEVPTQTTLSGYVLADGETRAALPNVTVTGRVWVTTDPGPVRNQSGVDPPRLIHLEGRLSLANGGERITLERDGHLVSAMVYGSVSEAELWQDGEAVPRGRTAIDPLSVSDSSATAFVVPEGAGIPIETLAEASSRILLAGYTFSSARVAGELIAAARRGVTVRVLVEGGPVGGIGTPSRTQLSRLAASAVSVRILDGPRSRYRFHHPKYAVVDGAAMVTSENWDPGGLGGHGTRGWGVVVQNQTLADGLGQLFQADWEWPAATRWSSFAQLTTFYPAAPATAEYHGRFPPITSTVERATLIAAPDNAESAIRELLARADESIRVVQPRIGNHTPLRQSLIEAARRGVSVQVLLSGSWYSADQNEGFARALRTVARREGLSLSISLAEPRARYSHLHAKGVLIDGETVILGSVNWNLVSTRSNREVAVVLRDDRIATYFQRVFRADRRGAAWRVPASIVAVIVGFGLLTIELVRRAVNFDVRPGDRRPVRPPPSSSSDDQERRLASQERMTTTRPRDGRHR